jgi:ribosomal protein S18 acetylase RimI-like enzyme
MSISNFLSRVTAYFGRHGFSATVHRAAVAMKRALLARRMVVFYCDLAKQASSPVRLPSSMKLERLNALASLSTQDLQAMTSFWNPKQAHRNILHQFDQGASLWLIKSGEELAGYGWTLLGRTMEPYYFRLGEDDVQLFDFYVFPKFRGRALHWVLTTHILKTLAAEGRARAFADTAEWNDAQLASFKMTPFRRLGTVSSFSILGRTFVSWLENEQVQQPRKSSQRKDTVPLVRTHEQ